MLIFSVSKWSVNARLTLFPLAGSHEHWGWTFDSHRSWIHPSKDSGHMLSLHQSRDCKLHLSSPCQPCMAHCGASQSLFSREEIDALHASINNRIWFLQSCISLYNVVWLYPESYIYSWSSSSCHMKQLHKNFICAKCINCASKTRRWLCVAFRLALNAMNPIQQANHCCDKSSSEAADKLTNVEARLTTLQVLNNDNPSEMRGHMKFR